MTSGIYVITHPKAKGSYVGKAANFDRRWGQHLDDLRAGEHCNHNLQKIANTYGVQSLRFKVLEECDRGALAHEEKKWIAKMGTWNIRPSQQQAKAALKKGKKKLKIPSGIKFIFWAMCGGIGFALWNVVGFFLCFVLGVMATNG